MKCPKCGYNSFDYLNSCRKCGNDLAGFKNTLGLRPVILPPVVAAQQVSETVPTGETPAPVEAASEMFHWETPVDTEAVIPQQSETTPFSLDLDETPAPAAASEDPFAFIDQPSPDAPSALAEPAPASPAAITLGDFSFEEQEPTAPEQPGPTSAETPSDNIDKAFGEFAFDEEPVAETAPAAPPVSDESPFGEFAFGEEPAAPVAETAPAAPSVSDESPFGEFAFGEEPGAETAPATPPDIDGNPFGEFAFDEEPAAQSADALPAAPSATDESPFGEFAFDETPALAPTQIAASDLSLETFGDLTEEQLQQEAVTAPEEGQEKKPSPGGTQFTKDEFDALFGELEALEKKK